MATVDDCGPHRAMSRQRALRLRLGKDLLHRCDGPVSKQLELFTIMRDGADLDAPMGPRPHSTASGAPKRHALAARLRCWAPERVGYVFL